MIAPAFDYEMPEPSLDTYFADIAELGLGLLTLEQEIALAQRIEQGDEQARETLIHANLRLVVHVANRYYTDHLTKQDLIQEGNIGLFHATRTYDWRRGFKFATHATYWIRQGITRAIQDKERSIKLPIYLGDLIRHMRKAREQLYMALGREPNDMELAEACECPIEHIQRAKLDTSSHVLSLDAQVDGHGTARTEDTELTLADLLEDLEDPYASIENMDQETLDAFEEALSQFKPRVAYVLRKRLGIDCAKQSLIVIGEHIGVTRERVRQIEHANMPKLRRLLAEWRREVCA